MDRERELLDVLRNNEDDLVIERLRAVDVSLSSIDQLSVLRLKPDAVQLLLELMRVVTHPAIKQCVIRAIATPAARGFAESDLVSYFEGIPSTDWASDHTKWVIGNTLEILGATVDESDLIRLAMDRRHGASRQMIVLALGKRKTRSAFGCATRLLDDPDVSGHAVAALGKMPFADAIPLIEAKLDDPKAWIRAEARRAIKKLRRLSVPNENP